MEIEDIKVVVGLESLSDQLRQYMEKILMKIANVLPSGPPLAGYPLDAVEELLSKLLEGYMHMDISMDIDLYCSQAKEALSRPREELPLMINERAPQQIVAIWRLSHEKKTQ